MYFNKHVVITIIFSTQLYSIDFIQLKTFLEENSKQLEFKKHDIDISKKDLDIIKSENYPTISIGFNIEKSKSLEDTLSGSSVGDNSLVTSSLKKSYGAVNLNYNLYSFGRFNKRKEIQKYTINTNKNEYCLEKKNLTLKLLETYNNSLNHQIKIENFKNIINKKSIIYNYKEKLFDSGNISKLEVTKNAIEIANLYSQITENKKELKSLINQIKLLTNYNISNNEYLEPLSLEESKDEIKFENTINAKTILSQIQAKKSEVSLQEKEFLPNLNLYSKYDVYGYDNASYRTAIEEMKENSYKFGLSLSLNLFDGFKTSSQKEKTLLQLKQLQTKYDLERDIFKNEILTINDNYELDLLNKKNRIKALRLSQMNNEDSMRLKEVGELGQVEILNSQIEEKYKELDYKLNEGKLAYEYTRRSILLEDDKCIVP